MLTKSRFYQVANLWIELTRHLHKAVAPEVQYQFGSRTSLLLVWVAVYLGTAEGKLMTASKLATFVGMPRTTVIRRLARLRRAGAIEKVGGKYRTLTKRMDGLARSDQMATLTRLVRTAHEKLR